MHDPTAAKVDSVVGIATTVSDQMCPRDKLPGFVADPRAESRHPIDVNLTLRLTFHSCQ